MRQKLALCVGINDYPGLESDLRGCVNDATDWYHRLISAGYQVRTLLDGQATCGAIVSELTRMVALAKRPGDRVVFTYSGHGTWVPDVSGDEADQRDEALVCYDHDQGGLLLDDTLQTIFAGLRIGAGGLILSDSCHSGTMARSMITPPEPQDLRVRFVSPAALDRVGEEEAISRELAPASRPRRTASLISGCTDLEYSYDASFNGRSNGAFSRAALDAYYPGIALRTWYRLIRERLPTEQYPQTPQLTANRFRRRVRAL